MAITRAQQVKQMLRNGGMSLQEAKDMAPKGEFLAYINNKEANMLKKAGGSGVMTKAGIPSFIEFGSDDPDTFSQAASTGSVRGDVDRGRNGGPNPVDEVALVTGPKTKTKTKDKDKDNFFNIFNPLSKKRKKFAYNLSMAIPGQMKRSKIMQTAYKNYLESMGVTPPDTLTGEEDDLAEFFVEDAFKKPVAADANVQPPKSYGEFIAENFGAPGVMMSGNVGGLEKFVKTRNPDGSPATFGYRKVEGGEGSNILLPQGIMAQAPSDMDQESEIEEDEGLRLAFRANGGRIGLENGGISLQEAKDMAPKGEFLAYINAKEAKMLKDAGGSGIMTNAGIPSFVEYGGQSGFESAKSTGSVQGDVDRGRGDRPTKKPIGGGGKTPDTTLKFKKDIPDSFAKKGGFDLINLGLIPDDEQDTMKVAKVFGETDLTNIGATEDKLFGGKKLSDQGKILEDFRKTAVNFKKSEQNTANTPQAALDFMTNRPGLFGDIIENKDFIQGAIDQGFLGDPSDYVNQKPLDQVLATGGRVGLMEGGMPYEGGIMDLESARQMYFLGKLVKKATRTVKKIAKSPIGKAALAAAAIKFGGPLAAKFAPGTFGSAAKSPFLRAIGRGQFFGDTGIFSAGKNLLFGPSAVGSNVPEGILSKIGPLGAIAGVSALAGLLTSKQEEEAQELSRGEGIDIEAARRMILQAGTSGDQRGLAFRAEGGRIGYQEGSKEPVAKKTMPLLDMGGKEMDLREDGGFVPIGRMEKADDVPARLSKNEFVFTADAVRNAGDGDVDKGAEVMYNMMKNLEAGGDVSEESQGLEGARKMFQTSQRLEEVL